MASTTGALLGKKSFEQADEVRKFDRGRLDVVNVGGHAMGRGTFEPGWRWSECIKPIAGTELCESEHLGYVVSGRMHVVMEDGSETEYGPGDAMYLQPRHDAWTVGNTPCVVLDFVGFADYARRK